MKNLLLIFYCFFLTLSANAQYLQWNSLLEEKSGAISNVHYGKMNLSDQLILSGEFTGNLDLDPNPNRDVIVSSSSGNANLFVSIYDEDGAFVMGNRIWSRSDLSAGGLAYDAQRSIYVSGIFNDTVDLNMNASQALYAPFSAGAEDAFIVKYSAQGVFQWARQLVSSSHTYSRDMELDQSGNIFLAGTFRGTTDFDPGSGTQNIFTPDEDIFIAKYTSSGNYLNAVRIGSANSSKGVQELQNLEIDGSNNVYISGRFEGDVDFDPGIGTRILTARGKNDFYIAKYNSSLQLVWAYQIGSASEEGAIDHKILDNELWIAGSFQDTIDANFKTGVAQLISQGQYDVFFARYNLSGSHQLSKSFGGTGVDEALSIFPYNSDSLMISGHFSGTVDFDPSSGSKSLTSSSSQTTFFGSYNSGGDLNWISMVKGSNDVRNAKIRCNAKGEPYLLGNLKGTANFNSASVFAQNFTGPASFVAKYAKCGQANIAISGQNASCGQRDGSAQATVTGGTAPLRYFWTSGHVSQAADSLRGGLYYLTVIDTLNCSYYSDPVSINELGGPSVGLTSKLDVTCNAGNDGAIVVNVSGGKLPYSYSWSNGSKNQNINGLKAGNYELTVTDGDNCKSYFRQTLGQPDAMKIYPVVTEPSCNTSNGSVTAVVTGGTPNYSYSWMPSGSSSTLFNIPSGVYTVTVTDGKNCAHAQAIAVSDDKAPDIFLDSIVEVDCGIGGGSIYVNVIGGTPNYNYQWNPGSLTTQDIIGVQPGNYSLIATDAAQCKGVFVASLKAKRPAAPGICIVDVDPLDGRATVVWEKPSFRGSIDYYNVYRETSTLNVFDLIEDSIDFPVLSLYKDTIADTWIRPWSYKISTTDTCGIESALSEFHTTIHAVITKNAQQEFNVLWSPYRGDFTVSQYTIFRYTNVSGTADSITTVPANIFSYTDANSPSKGGDVYYFIQTVHPDGCTATEAQNRNSSRSNRGSIDPPEFTSIGINDINSSRSHEVVVFPNPAIDRFSLEIKSKNSTSGSIRLFGIQGKEYWKKAIEIKAGKYLYEFPVEQIPNGLYFVEIQFDDGIYLGKLMITDR